MDAHLSSLGGGVAAAALSAAVSAAFNGQIGQNSQYGQHAAPQRLEVEAHGIAANAEADAKRPRLL